MESATAAMRRPSHEDHSEGAIAKAIENQTARLPSDLFLWAAVASMSCSFALQVSGRRHTGLFIGQWADLSDPRPLQQVGESRGFRLI